MDFDEEVVCEGVKYTAMLTHRPLASNELFDPLSTAPVRSGSVDINIHGHLHDRRMSDRRYVNVCVEQTNYTPVDLHELIVSRVEEVRNGTLN